MFVDLPWVGSDTPSKWAIGRIATIRAASNELFDFDE